MFLVAAQELGIIWGDIPEYWEWLSCLDSMSYILVVTFYALLILNEITLLNTIIEKVCIFFIDFLKWLNLIGFVGLITE